MRNRFPKAMGFAVALVLTGCHHQTRQASNHAPDRPDWSSGYPHKQNRTATRTTPHAPAPVTRHEPVPPPLPATEDSLRGKPTLVETGMASWYGPQYNHAKSANGEVYDQNGMTAAHRTLPLGTLARVTNETTGQSVVVRITDRGPFVAGRVLDMSEGAAKAIGLYRMGVAKVKVEAYAPPTASQAGIWCVQTGAFQTSQDATDLKSALISRYKTAKVQQFQGPTGYWVRIDPAGRDKQQAIAIQDWIGKPDDHAQSFLVRLD